MVADAGDWEDGRQVEHMGGSTETAAQSNVAANDLMAHCRVVAPVERPCAFSQDAGCETARFSGLGKSWHSRDAMASWRRLEEAAAMAASGCRIRLRKKIGSHTSANKMDAGKEEAPVRMMVATQTQAASRHR